MTSFRKTKIVATLGPASSNADMIKNLLDAGANVFRLNFSHGTQEDHAKALGIIRKLEKERGEPIAVLADMQGPKLRIGDFTGGEVELTQGQTFRFDLNDAPGDETRVNLPHPEVMDVLEEGGSIFLDDGKVRARIVKKGKDFAEAEILSGTKLSNKKGLNVPGALIPIPALTDKDKADLKAALDMGADWIAQSFVQTPEDVKEARELIGDRAALLVKIEKPAALKHIDEIIALADGVMLARGDLGVEIPPEDVPSVQKRVVRKVRETGKPIIVATQMLESMITNARPTRAEASDVATAVYDGADAVMLSGETAMGAYPQRAVEIMARICVRTEEDETYVAMMDNAHPDEIDDPSDAITAAAYYVAQDVEAVAIVTYTASGSTALRMARHRPDVPILCLTPDEIVARRMMLSYAVRSIQIDENLDDFTGPAKHAAKIIEDMGFASKGERFIMTAGVPFGTPGTTNLLRIAEVE